MRERDFYTNPIDSFSRVPNSGHFQHFGWSLGHLGSQTITSCLVRSWDKPLVLPILS